MNTAPTPRSWLARLRAVPRRVLLLALLLPVLFAVWIPVVTGGNRPTAPSPAVSAEAEPRTPHIESTVGQQTAPPAAPAGETLALPAADVAAAAATRLEWLQQVTAPYTPRWSPSAGQPFGRISRPVRVAVATTSDPLLAPSAIVLSRAAAPVAIVQGRSHRVGDTVAGHTIVAIEERRVVYRDGDVTFAVALPSPSLGERP